MRIFRTLPSEEEIQALLKLFDMCIDDIDKTDTFSVARGVMKMCEMLIPKEFIELCENCDGLELFVKDTLSYLTFNTYQCEILGKDKKDESKPHNYNDISNAIRDLNTLVNKGKWNGIGLTPVFWTIPLLFSCFLSFLKFWFPFDILQKGRVA